MLYCVCCKTLQLLVLSFKVFVFFLFFHVICCYFHRKVFVPIGSRRVPFPHKKNFIIQFI